MSKPAVRMSVRAVVETTHHESDLSPAAGAAKRMREGAAAHRARQSFGAAQEETYRHEVALSADYEGEALLLHVTGRADAIFTREDGMQVIEEIKLGAQDMPLIPAHMAQAAVYGHMLCASEGLQNVCLRVLYVDTQGENLNVYECERSARELYAEFDALCAVAAAWEEKKLARRQRRDASLEDLAFPFDAYREGQRRFAANVYVAIRERKRPGCFSYGAKHGQKERNGCDGAADAGRCSRHGCGDRCKGQGLSAEREGLQTGALSVC